MSPRQHRSFSSRSIAATLAALTVLGTLSACGSDDGSATEQAGSAAATATDPVTEPGTANGTSNDAPAATADATPATTAAAVDPATETAPAPSAADACAALPSLEQISSVMGVTLTTATPLERGPGFDLCEAGGASDDVTNVQFTRLTDTSREQSIELAEQLGYPATDLTDPALPGGFTYASAAAINIGGTEYTVQAIGLDTLGDPNSPIATERSAQLLVIWLANLGVSP